MKTLIAKAASELGIMDSAIPPYHTQAYLVERVNSVLKIMISLFAEGHHRTWDKHLSDFSFASNTAVHIPTYVHLKVCATLS